MFLIAVDNSSRLLVERNSGSDGTAVVGLPFIEDGTDENSLNIWFESLGCESALEIKFFNLKISTQTPALQYAICSLGDSKKVSSRFELLSLDLLWKQEIGASIAVAINHIVKLVDSTGSGVIAKYEEKFLKELNCKKVSPRVFFAQSETVAVNQTVISFLGAFALVNGQQTARLCIHQDQRQKIQEMLIIHAEPISTGPLRQNNDSSVSYHMIRGALEIILHYGGEAEDKTYKVEHNQNQPSVVLSLRVPAKVFRTIRTLTDSAVFIEVQSGPFSDSDTEWQL